MGKLTKTQIAYLKSAAINPSGRTAIPGGTATLEALVNAGVVVHLGLGIVSITAAGRAALKSGAPDA